jgi:hypothetical protein
MAIGSVKLGGTPQQYSSPRVSENAFGAGVGTALKTLAGAFEDYDTSLTNLEIAQQAEVTRRNRFDANLAGVRLNGEMNRTVADLTNNAPANGEGLTEQTAANLAAMREQFLSTITDPKIRDEMTLQTEGWYQSHITNSYLNEHTLRVGYDTQAVTDLVQEFASMVGQGDATPEDAIAMMERAIELTSLSETERNAATTEGNAVILGSAFQAQAERTLRSNLQFKDTLNRFVASAPPDIQAELSIISGERSPANQADIIGQNMTKPKYGFTAEEQTQWFNDVAQFGPERAGEMWATAFDAANPNGTTRLRDFIALPGRSQHQTGSAADLGFASERARAWVHANAAAFGLHFPVPGENWHIELVGGRDASGNLPTIPDVWNNPLYASLSYDQKTALEGLAGQTVTAEQNAILGQQKALADQLRAQIAAGDFSVTDSINNAIRMGQIPADTIDEFINANRDMTERKTAATTFGNSIANGLAIANTPENQEAALDYYRTSGILAGMQNLEPNAAEAFARDSASTGFIPEDMLASIQAMIGSSNPQQLEYGLNLLSSMEAKSPVFAGMVPKELVAAEAFWSTARRYNPAGTPQALTQYQQMADPKNAALREQVRTEAEKELKSITDGDIADAFDNWVPFNQPGLPTNPNAYALFKTDFNTLYIEGRARGLSSSAATEAATKAMSKSWVNETIGGSGTLMLNGPSAPAAGYINTATEGGFRSSEEIHQDIARSQGWAMDKPFDIVPDKPVKGQPISFTIFAENDRGEYTVVTGPNGNALHFQPSVDEETIANRNVMTEALHFEVGLSEATNHLKELQSSLAGMENSIALGFPDPGIEAVREQIAETEKSVKVLEGQVTETSPAKRLEILRQTIPTWLGKHGQNMTIEEILADPNLGDYYRNELAKVMPEVTQ